MKEAMVTLYVVPDCPLCERARVWLTRHGITYVERDVSRNFGALRDMYMLTKQRLVPVFAVEKHALVRPTANELADFFLKESSS